MRLSKEPMADTHAERIVTSPTKKAFDHGLIERESSHLLQHRYAISLSRDKEYSWPIFALEEYL